MPKPRVQDQPSERYCSCVLGGTELEAAGLAASKAWVQTTCLSLLLPESGLSAALALGYRLLLPVKAASCTSRSIFYKAEDRSQRVLKTHSKCN